MKNNYIGIDLGTSNSACAMFDGTDLQVVRNTHGGDLTPSVVRINSKGKVVVGSKAHRYLERDPANTRTEFKRLMGTDQYLDFPASGQKKSVTELSAIIISSLLDDVEQQFNFRPTQALVTVPALFDLPQSNATAEAAKAAGLEKIELLQEPVASALAAGWNEESLEEHWLVFDLGGGTFDASLLEYRDGMLRVIAHDGDNFLGGRDFDKALTGWIISRISEEHGITLHLDRPEHNEALRLLALAAEEAKIDLSSKDEASVSLLDDIDIDGQEIEVDFSIDRQTFESLCLPLVERTMVICKRLLLENGIGKGGLDQVVMVGGPSMMPIIRNQVKEHLAPIAPGALDPMTLVAQGAALYAATTGLAASPAGISEQSDKMSGNKFLLQHPSMSSDLNPVVLGRLIEKAEPAPATVCLFNKQSSWISEKVKLQDDTFMLEVQLQAKCNNIFELQAFSSDGTAILVEPQHFSVVHGLSISDPPLSRSIGIALANGQVHQFFERGTPLPVKRVFTRHSVDTVLGGESNSAVVIPIVQGEFQEARFCRSIGTLTISGKELEEPLLAGTGIEISLELDRGGNLEAQAFVPSIGRLFNGVLHLLTPNADPETLYKEAGRLRQRLNDLQKQGFQENKPKRVSRYADWLKELERAERDLELLKGSDQDAGMRASHCLTGIEAKIDQEEALLQLENRVESDKLSILYECDWIQEYGTEREKGMLTQALHGIERAAEQKNLADYTRQQELISKLANIAYNRSPDSWVSYFDDAVSRVHEASDLKKANKLVQQGRAAIAAEDHKKLKTIVRGIWHLLPSDTQLGTENFNSGIR